MQINNMRFPTWIVSFALLIVLMLTSLGGVGCSKQSTKSTEVKPPKPKTTIEPIKFTPLALAAAPKEVQELAQKNSDKETITLIAVGRDPYILVTRGVKTTGGYSATIKYVRQEEQDWGKLVVAGIKYTDPEPGQIVTQVLTYPVAVAKLELHSLPDALSFELIQPTQAVQGKT